MVPIVSFFNLKSGLGQTTLVYNLAWKLADLGIRVLVADLDPQAHLTAAFLDEDELESIWVDPQASRQTISGSLQAFVSATGELGDTDPFIVNQLLGLVPGDTFLSRFEDDLSSEWLNCIDGQVHAFRATAAIWRILQRAARRWEAQVVLMDLGPNLGAINRAALIAADAIVVPLAPDLFSLQGLRNLGPTVRAWRADWKSRLEKNPEPSLDLPKGEMKSAGYVVLQRAVRLDRPVQAYAKWLKRIPAEYAHSMLGSSGELTRGADPNQIAQLKDYRNLMPMAHEARKPMFHLKPADGALGAYLTAANAAGTEFASLARTLLSRIGVDLTSA